MFKRTKRQEIGQKGEDIASDFLKKKGFEIVERNYWQKWGEIDIVAKKGGAWRFVEVKTVTRSSARSVRRRPDDYEPEDNIHPWKRRRLARVIETYILSRGVGDDDDWQVDTIAVYLDLEGNFLEVDHLEDIEL